MDLLIKSSLVVTSVLLLVVQEGVQFRSGVGVGGGEGVAGRRDQGGGEVDGAGARGGEGEVQVVVLIVLVDCGVQGGLGGVELSQLRVHSTSSPSTSSTSSTSSSSSSSILGQDRRLIVRGRPVRRDEARGRHHDPQLVQLRGAPGRAESLRAPAVRPGGRHGGAEEALGEVGEAGVALEVTLARPPPHSPPLHRARVPGTHLGSAGGFPVCNGDH